MKKILTTSGLAAVVPILPPLTTIDTPTPKPIQRKKGKSKPKHISKWQLHKQGKCDGCPYCEIGK